MKRKISILILIITIAFSISSYAKVYLSIDEALKKIYPDADTIDVENIDIAEGSFTFYIGKKRGELIGYTFILTETGKHGPITFAITITEDGKIKDTTVLEMMEVKGEKITKKRFLRQFIGKGLRDPLRLGRDIHAVTGATISSNVATEAARKALIIWEGLFSQ